jgi:hypothetical protein
MGQDVGIEDFLREAGFDTPGATARAREVLEAAGLTRPGKQAMASAKLRRAADTLAATLVRVCGDRCLAVDRSGPERAREAVSVTKSSCEVCGGSNNAQAALAAASALGRRGLARVLIVGGSPGVWDGVERAFAGTNIKLRFVDGTQRSSAEKESEANKRWAEVMIIWGATELRHAVSVNYTRDVPQHVRQIKIARRGVTALCDAIVESFR